MSPVIKLAQETLEARLKVVEQLTSDCEALKQAAMLTQGQSLSDGRLIDVALLTPRRENLQRYRQLRVQVDLHNKALSDMRETTLRLLAYLCHEETLAKYRKEEQKETPKAGFQPSQQLMSGIDNLLVQLQADKHQLQAMQGVLAGEIRRTQQIEKLRAMFS